MYINIGATYLDWGHPQDLAASERALQQSISISPSYPAYSNLGILYLKDPHRFGKSRAVGCYLGCSRDEETLVRASRSCTSARKAIPICERCWCKGHNTFWDRSV